ncbi:hypothetical protein RRG08_029079 [Elysia crispata]|uniref:Uncharacterized protein n=1 Tax=Elysia crispata TaxID=231223 RepID=A0AAE0ZK91_9GAST|nr:hypothetical protein RRG08_029079 [Elysia crispata]
MKCPESRISIKTFCLPHLSSPFIRAGSKSGLSSLYLPAIGLWEGQLGLASSLYRRVADLVHRKKNREIRRGENNAETTIAVKTEVCTSGWIRPPPITVHHMRLMLSMIAVSSIKVAIISQGQRGKPGLETPSSRHDGQGIGFQDYLRWVFFGH